MSARTSRRPDTMTRYRASRRPAAALSCKPNQRTPAPWQGFKATAPQGFEPRPAGAESVPIEPAPSGRSTDPGIPPDLLNLTKGLSMAKTAPVSSQTARKSVPVSHLLQSAQILQIRPCTTVIARSYTLCEVDNGDRQFVPVTRPESPCARLPRWWPAYRS